MEKFLCLNRVAFSVFGYDIYWYGVLMCLAIISAIVVATIFCKIRGISVDTPLNVALVAVPSGILGGRLFAVLFDSDLSIKDYFKFRDGGMSIMGCIIGGAIALTIYTIIKCKKTGSKDIFLYFDVIASVLLLSQAIGRWGNYFNSEIYGQAITSEGIFSRFPFAVTVNGTKYQALFFYESVIDFIGFIFTAQIFLTVKKDGYTTGFYLLYYGAVRTVLEKFRQEAFILKIGSIPVSLLVSVVIFVSGLVILTISIHRFKQRKKESRD